MVERTEPVPPSKWNTKFAMGEDKKLHFLAGIAVVGVCAALGLPIVAMILILIGVAVGKEIVDACGYGTPDVWDAAFTIMGGCCILIFVLLMKNQLDKKKNGGA